MAGGIGSRFWPMSREHRPKQFLDVLGIGKSLLQMTYERLKRIVPDDQIFVVTNEKYAALVAEQIPLKTNQILTEPMRKNTAPAIAYAAHKIMSLNADANLIIASSDHLILKEDVFVEVIQKALEKSASGDYLLTIGIKPTRPDTGYGYIQFEKTENYQDGDIKKVIQFTEKPKLEKAQSFLASGDYFWNSGIFVWTAANVTNALEKFKPALNALFKTKGNDYNTANEQTFVNNAFTQCEDISIDYAVLEPAKNVYVTLADLGWSDLGTWGSLYTHLNQDENGNASIGNNIYLVESKNNIINLPKDKKVLIQGLENYIVVESDNILMIVKQEDEQRIKDFVSKIKKDLPDIG